MNQRIAHVALVVEDYDDAIRFFTHKLGFKITEDTKLGESKRWVIVTPPNSNTCSLLLAQAASEKQRAAIGNQTGGRVFLFLYTDDFWRDYETMKAKKVEFTEEPRKEIYGTVVVFKDLYGNLWDLIEPKK